MTVRYNETLKNENEGAIRKLRDWALQTGESESTQFLRRDPDLSWLRNRKKAQIAKTHWAGKVKVRPWQKSFNLTERILIRGDLFVCAFKSSHWLLSKKWVRKGQRHGLESCCSDAGCYDRGLDCTSGAERMGTYLEREPRNCSRRRMWELREGGDLISAGF